MKKAGKRKWHNWKKLFLGVLLLIFVVIILLRFAELKQIASLIEKIKWGWFALAILMQFMIYVSLAVMYKIIARKVPFWTLLKTPMSMTFIDQAIPSFSASGNALLYYVARKKEDQGRAALLVGLNIFLSFLFFILLFFVSLVYLAAYIGGVTHAWIWMASLIGVAFILVYRILWTAGGKKHFKAFIAFVLKKWPNAKQKAIGFLDNFYTAKKGLRKRTFALAMLFALLSYVFKIAAIGVVFLALGSAINPGTIIVGYVTASFMAGVSYIMMGVYEASMTLAYSRLGMAYDFALTVTLLYRLIASWIPMILGLIFFNSLLKENNKKKK